MMRELVKAAVPIILTGLLTAGITITVVTTRLEEQMVTMQRDMVRHETALDKEIQRHEASLNDLTRRTDDQERRLTRSESTLESIGIMLTEIRGDVKQILRGDNAGGRP